MENIKVHIKEKATNLSKNISIRKNEDKQVIEKEINVLENKLALNPNSEEVLDNLNKLKLKYEIIAETNTKGAIVRSRVKWIEEGERNTKYFFNLEKVKKQQNTITSLKETSYNQTTHNSFKISEEIFKSCIKCLDRLWPFSPDLVLYFLSQIYLAMFSIP